jgi:hypothetical protein
MNAKKINWFGLAGGVAIIAVVVFSLGYALPWWQLTAGQGNTPFAQANVSPLNFGLSFLGTVIAIPLSWFLNLASILSLVASAIAILIYSFTPEKNYSKHLLGFAYKKPLITLILFVGSLIAVTTLAGMFLPFSLPVTGSTTASLDSEGISISIPITTTFTWVFWLAIVAAALCIAARIYHKRIVSIPTPAPAQAPAATSSTA